MNTALHYLFVCPLLFVMIAFAVTDNRPMRFLEGVTILGRKVKKNRLDNDVAFALGFVVFIVCCLASGMGLLFLVCEAIKSGY